MASATVETSETAMGECVSKAPELEGNLDTAGWQTFELIRKLPEEHQATAKAILADLQKALASDEHVLELAPALRSAQAQAMRLLEKLVEVKPPKPPITPPPIEPPPKKEKRIVGQDSKQDLTLPAAKEVLSDLDGKLKSGQSVRVNVSWVIEEGEVSGFRFQGQVSGSRFQGQVMAFQSFEDLEVWKRSCALAVFVYEALSEARDFGLRDQMQRAAVSIPSNIAEGYERTDKDFIRFLVIAKGSAAELAHKRISRAKHI